MKRTLIAAFAILACLMFAWATGAGRPYPASAGGVIDPTCTSSSPCIEYDNNGTGPGVRGISLVGNGLSGSTKNKSTSTTNGRAGLIGNDVGTGSFNSGVHGLSVNGTGVSGLSTAGAGVNGVSTSYVGVYGSSTGYTGVFGIGPTYGVAGSSVSGVGVYGSSTTGAANGIGVQGLSSDGVGVNAIGGFAPGGSSDDLPALSIVSNGTNDLIDACNGSPNPCDKLNSTFRVSCCGEIQAKFTVEGSFLLGDHGVESDGGGFDIVGTGQYLKNGNCVAGCSAATTVSTGRAVTTYAPQSSQPMIEDNGEAQLVNGAAYVRVDSAFANVIDQRTVYSVSITPEGNSNGLFVTQKTLTGFAVRENNGGKSTLAFEYRIVAKPFGSTAKRLPMVDIPLRRTIGARAWHPGGLVPIH